MKLLKAVGISLAAVLAAILVLVLMDFVCTHLHLSEGNRARNVLVGLFALLFVSIAVSTYKALK